MKSLFYQLPIVAIHRNKNPSYHIYEHINALKIEQILAHEGNGPPLII